MELNMPYDGSFLGLLLYVCPFVFPESQFLPLHPAFWRSKGLITSFCLHMFLEPRQSLYLCISWLVQYIFHPRSHMHEFVGYARASQYRGKGWEGRDSILANSSACVKRSLSGPG